MGYSLSVHASLRRSQTFPSLGWQLWGLQVPGWRRRAWPPGAQDPSSSARPASPRPSLRRLSGPQSLFLQSTLLHLHSSGVRTASFAPGSPGWALRPSWSRSWTQPGSIDREEARGSQGLRKAPHSYPARLLTTLWGAGTVTRSGRGHRLSALARRPMQQPALSQQTRLRQPVSQIDIACIWVGRPSTQPLRRGTWRALGGAGVGIEMVQERRREDGRWRRTAGTMIPDMGCWTVARK